MQWDLARELLRLLELQTMPAHEFEIILVNNGPPESVELRELPANATLLHCSKPGAYAARNAAAPVARAPLLAFTDADCWPASEWLEKLVAAAEALPGTLAAGDIRVVSRAIDPNPYEKFDILHGLRQQLFVSRGFGATANLVAPTAVWDEIGGFDERRLSGSDADFCLRAGAEGHAISYVPDAIVLHPARATWHELKTKARRIKGGQLTSGTLKRRLYWLTYIAIPPVKTIAGFMRNARYPLRDRFEASGVRLRLWGVELAEAFRLLVLRRAPERR
jgi:glycosyltransferase involved in cell wall biosynthesis